MSPITGAPAVRESHPASPASPAAVVDVANREHGVLESDAVVLS